MSDNNVNSITEHSKPLEGMECMSCLDDITEENYVEYRVHDEGKWLPSYFCEYCIAYLLETQWTKYVQQLAKATCKAEQNRLLDRGPPIYIYDKTALPCPEGLDVHYLWLCKTNTICSAKLAGSLEGIERQIWWDEKLAFRFDETDESLPN